MCQMVRKTLALYANNFIGTTENLCILRLLLYNSVTLKLNSVTLKLK